MAWGLDPDPARRASFAARFPGTATFADATEITPAHAADIVSVCSPTSMHASGVEFALRSRARVIVCEKPIAPTAVEGQAVVARCRAAGCLLLVNYSRRFSPMLEHLRRETAGNGVLAGSVKGCIRYNGGLIHNGTHWIDLCRAMFGDVAMARALPVDGDTGQDVPRTAELTFPGDRSVLLLGLADTSYSIGEGEFFGRDGAIRFAESGATLSGFASIESPIWPGYRTLGVERVLTREGMRGNLTALARHVVALARDGGAPSCTGEDGVAALEVAERALREACPSTDRS